MHRIARATLVLGLLLLSACATRPKSVGTASNMDLEREASQLPPATIQEKEVSSEEVEKNIERPYQSAYGSIDLDQNEHVDKWVRYFQGRGRHHMELYLARSARYLPMMKNVLRENGLPEELVYIALIESGFSPRAHSHANAVGYWQFIRGTGKRFGLQIDTFVDERRDPVLSTRAAAEYFKALYGLLGSWHLSMAAYNVGENRVKRAVSKYYTRNFWELIKRRRALPSETRNYVPKFIAATMIAKDPAKYGFTNIEYQDPLSYDTVALQSPISLSKLAANINVDVDELKLLNPKFRTDFVPLSRNNETVVRIPVGRATDALAALSMSVTQPPKVLQADYYFYKIRSGDNLSTIARKHRTTVSQLRRLNDLSNRTVLRVGRKLRVPDVGGDSKIQFVSEEDTRQPAGRRATIPAVGTAEPVDFHVVRSGENLSVIARRYGLTVADILRLNNLSPRSVIRKGQKIRVREESSPRSAVKRSQKRSVALAEYRPSKVSKVEKSGRAQAKTNKRVAATTKRHTVRRGETLYDVSKRYGVSISELAKANKVKRDHRVLAGEKLMIP